MTSSPHPAAGPDGPAAPMTDPTLRRAPRTMLWVLLVISTVGNTVVSAAGGTLAVHAGFAVVTGLCVAALIAAHLRRRP